MKNDVQSGRTSGGHWRRTTAHQQRVLRTSADNVHDGTSGPLKAANRYSGRRNARPRSPKREQKAKFKRPTNLRMIAGEAVLSDMKDEMVDTHFSMGEVLRDSVTSDLLNDTLIPRIGLEAAGPKVFFMGPRRVPSA